MGTIASQITSLGIVYSTVYSGADQRKHQSSASLAFVQVSHRGPVNSPHKWPVTRKMFPFDDVIMRFSVCIWEVIIMHLLWADDLIRTRSWRTVILSTSLKLRTYLNLRTPVLKFKYDFNPRLLSSYCKITFENLCSTKWIPHDYVVPMKSHLVDRKRNRWHPDIIVKNKINHSFAQKP